MSKSIIVIGGTGFLGRKILENLVYSGFHKIACGDLVNPDIKNIDFHPLNILDSRTLYPLKKFDIVINCTGQITIPIEGCLLQNTLGIKNIIDSLDADSHLVQISSVGVYGTVAIAGEDFPLNPETPYSTAKSVAEVWIQNVCRPQKYSILRLCNLYGPDQPKGVISYLYRSFLTDKDLFFEHNGSLERFFLHTEDCVKTITSFISENPLPYGIFNLSSKEKYSIRDLVRRLESIKNFSYTINWGSQKPWENIGDIPIGKIQKVTNYEPTNSLMNYMDSTFNN
jgi:nucleoside-diphosphate-sugar epimerase